MSRSRYLETRITYQTPGRLELEQDSLLTAIKVSTILAAIFFWFALYAWETGDDELPAVLAIATILSLGPLWFARRSSARFDRPSGTLTLSHQWLWRRQGGVLSLGEIAGIEMRSGVALEQRGFNLPFRTGYPVAVLHDGREIRLMGADFGTPDETAALITAIRRWLAAEAVKDTA